MLLNNYYTLKKANALCYVYDTFISPSVVGSGLTVRANNGDLVLLTDRMVSGYDHLRLSDQFIGVGTYNSTGRLIVGFGSGNTPPTADDYTLETPLSSISRQSGKTIITDNGHINELVCVNNNDVAVTISEVVIWSSFSATEFDYSTSKHAVVREVFDTPITVEPGEYFTFRFEYVVGD